LNRSILSFCVGLSALAGLVASLQAQTYEQVAPKTPAPPPAKSPSEPDADAGATPAAADDRVILPALRGIVFVTSTNEFHRDGVSVEGVQVGGDPKLQTPAFHSLAAAYLGRPLSRSSLDRLTRDVVLYFRRHGRPVVDVLVPEQNISTGTVQILVIEGRLGAVRSEGNNWFSAELLKKYVRARPGEIIEGGPLLADLAWINQNPFRQVDLVFSRGTEPGETDIILRTRDRFPLRVYTGYEDSGNALTGFDRVLAGVNWGNAFGLDQQMNYQLSASPDFKKMVAQSGSYIVPIPSLRDTFTVFGSYAESRPDLSGGAFDLKGLAWQVSARYRLPLPVEGTETRDLTVGVDFKRSNNNLSFGGTQVFAQDNDVVQATAAASFSRPDKYGITAGELTVAASPGGVTSNDSSEAYLAARAYAKPDYAYARLDLERTTKLPAKFSWVTRGSAQLASANLLGSEQLGLGGSDNLRGYEEREANGDNGFVLVDELHGPPLQVARLFGRGLQDDRLDPLVFIDYGVVGSHKLLPGEPNYLELASSGLGIRYNFGNNFSLRADYGWQLKQSGVSDLRRTSRGYLSAVLSY
jgi:hemolysin activation/secretion protein